MIDRKMEKQEKGEIQMEEGDKEEAVVNFTPNRMSGRGSG